LPRLAGGEDRIREGLQSVPALTRSAHSFSVAFLSGARPRTSTNVCNRLVAAPSNQRRSGPPVEEPKLIMSMSSTPISEIEQELRPRARTLSWMASLSVAAGQMRAAEGYLLELLAWCAFADRDIIDLAGDNDRPAQS
jgi:hypothetical protein